MRYLTLLLILLYLPPAIAQSTVEENILFEVRKLVGFIDQFQQITPLVNDSDFKIAAGVAHSVARSVNIAMNAYHLIHIQTLITGKEDKAAVSSYVMKQIPNLIRLIKIEARLSSDLIESCSDDKVLDKSKEYLTSLQTIISTLDGLKLI